MEQWGCTAAELGSVDSLSGHWPGKVEGFFCNPSRQTLVVRGPAGSIASAEHGLLLPHALSKDLLGQRLRSTIIQHFLPI